MVGTFRNESSEHIDTGIISIIMENNIANSGKLIFVAGGDARQELRDERQDQQVNASEATASSLGYETGAALLLTGTVRSIVERAGNRTVRSYFVNAELTNIQTNERLWMGLNDEIKKEVRQPNIRF
jgi:PBP1b-binding outer membrane lipoprotein LpoB